MPANEARRLPPRTNRAEPKPKFPVPWGLFIVLTVYALGVLVYVWQEYWESPLYQASQHYAAAMELLGVDDGRSCTPEQLKQGFDELVETARLWPEEQDTAEHVERLRHRFEERGLKLDAERVRRAEAVSVLARRIREQRAPILVVGARDRGWAPDQLAAKPKTVAVWSVGGAVLIIAVWAYLQFAAWRVRSKERLEYVDEIDDQVREAGQFRKGLYDEDDATKTRRRRR